jgi:hypothetical protein
VAEEVIGSQQAAHAMSKADCLVPHIHGFPANIYGKRFRWNPELQLFWDCELLSREMLTRELGPTTTIARAIYACSCTGDEDKAHEMRVQLRSYGFEPIVVRERILRTKELPPASTIA